METPAQIILVRDRSNADTNAFEGMLRLAFEGSAGPAGSASTYLQDAVDLQIRVLDLPRIPRGKPLDGLLTGARRTVVVVVHSDDPNPPLPVQYTDSVRPILQARQPEVALVTHDDIGSPVATS